MCGGDDVVMLDWPSAPIPPTSKGALACPVHEEEIGCVAALTEHT